MIFSLFCKICLTDSTHHSESQAQKELNAPCTNVCTEWHCLLYLPLQALTKWTKWYYPLELMHLIFSSVFCSPSHQRCLGTCVQEKEPFLEPGRNKQVLISDTVYLKRSSQCRMYDYLYRAGTSTKKCLESFLNIALRFIIQVLHFYYIFSCLYYNIYF